jgi:hypothetical protein
MHSLDSYFDSIARIGQRDYLPSDQGAYTAFCYDVRILTRPLLQMCCDRESRRLVSPRLTSTLASCDTGCST